MSHCWHIQYLTVPTLAERFFATENVVLVRHVHLKGLKEYCNSKG